MTTVVVVAMSRPTAVASAVSMATACVPLAGRDRISGVSPVQGLLIHTAVAVVRCGSRVRRVIGHLASSL